MSHKPSWIIQIKVDGTQTGIVGPFDAECVADMYCDTYLEPNMPGAVFHIEELQHPDELVSLLKNATVTK